MDGLVNVCLLKTPRDGNETILVFGEKLFGSCEGISCEDASGLEFEDKSFQKLMFMDKTVQ